MLSLIGTWTSGMKGFGKAVLTTTLLAGVGLSAWPSNSVAEDGANYRIDRFRCDETLEVGEVARISVEIENKGSTDPGTSLTVFGKQKEGVKYFPIPENGITVFVEPGGKLAQEFLQSISAAGEIKWRVTTDQDDAECETKVILASNDDDDDSTGGNDRNIIALHNLHSPQYDRHCLDCHADVTHEPTLNPSFQELTAHGSMLPFAPGKPGDDKQCTWCHRSIGMEPGMPSPGDELQGSLRKHVDPAACTLCHGPDGPGPQYYQARLSDLMTDGESLYALVCSSCHGVLGNSEVKGESAEEIRSKILEDEGGMGPLDPLTDEQLQRIADALKK